MNKVILTLAASGAALIASAPALADPATTIVNVSAYDANAIGNAPTPVTQTFGPGSYTISVIGKAAGGLYDGWSVATPAATNWDERYNYVVGNNPADIVAVNPYASQRFATAGDALSAFSNVLQTFTLTQATAVTFGIPDYLWVDNTGGVSLGITAGSPASVPEPATIGLFGLGMLGLYAMRRRQKNAAAY